MMLIISDFRWQMQIEGIDSLGDLHDRHCQNRKAAFRKSKTGVLIHAGFGLAIWVKRSGAIVFFQQTMNIGRSGTDSLLNATHQFVFLAFDVGQVVIGQIAVSLFEFPFNHIPITFEIELCCVHDLSFR